MSPNTIFIHEKQNIYIKISTFIKKLQGYENKEQISDDLRLILGNFRYDNESKNTLQFFSAQVSHIYNFENQANIL